MNPNSQEVRDLLSHYEIPQVNINKSIFTVKVKKNIKKFNYRIKIDCNMDYQYWITTEREKIAYDFDEADEAKYYALINNFNQIKYYALINNFLVRTNKHRMFCYMNNPSIEHIDQVLMMINKDKSCIPSLSKESPKVIDISYFPTIDDTKHIIKARRQKFPYNCRFEVIMKGNTNQKKFKDFAKLNNITHKTKKSGQNWYQYNITHFHIDDDDILAMCKFKFLKFISKIIEYKHEDEFRNKYY